MEEQKHISEETCEPQKPAHSVWHQAACAVAYPGKMVVKPFHLWYHKRYHGKYPYPRALFGFDLFLLGIIAALAGIAIFFAVFFKLNTFADKILLEFSTEPRELVAGSDATFDLKYANTTGEDLSDVKIHLGYPRDFRPRRLTVNGAEQPGDRVTVGDLENGAGLSVRAEGTLFGDVGSEQTLRAILTYRRTEKHVGGQKITTHAIVPSRGALALDAALPAKVAAFQAVDGTVTVRNEGAVALDDVRLELGWPAGFTFLNADKPFQTGAFRLGKLEAGAATTLAFHGVVGETEGSATFSFIASAAEGDNRYRLGTAVAQTEVIPPPLRVSHSADADTLRPGSEAKFTVHYENAGDVSLTNVRVGVASDSPFAKTKEALVPIAGPLEPGASGDVTVSIPLRSGVNPSETTQTENISFKTRATAAYLMNGQEIRSRGAELSNVLTTPVTLSVFARYTAPGGDQIGRGPLPPVVGEQTTYWIFLNVAGTTNPLDQVRVETKLGPNVRLTGRQSLIQEGSLSSGADGSVVWTPGRLNPTLAPSSAVAGAAFEVAITPTESQIGKIPVLLESAKLTARDATTGSFVSASSGTVTTNLPNDPKAAGHAKVEAF
jgi:hypothetical protein